MADPTIAVAIPVHPRRLTNGKLGRAVASVAAQTLTPAGLAVAVDLDRRGAPHTRQAALDMVDPSYGWIAFLDSDDEFHPDHLAALWACARDTGADYVYSWFDSPCHFDPFPDNFGIPFDPAKPVETTSTILVRADLARQVRFSEPPADWHGLNTAEDRRFTLGCIDAGARIVHLPRRTWTWHNCGDGNTSGLPTKGDAVPRQW